MRLRNCLKVGNVPYIPYKNENIRAIISNAVEAESEEGIVMLADKRDLIWLKRARGSKQDQADIEKLEDDKDR